MLTEATRRIQAEPASYQPKVYGADEVGGTSVFYISKEPFDKLGFKTDLEKTPMPVLTANVLEKIPGIVSLGASVLYGIYWITNRRMELARPENQPENSTQHGNGGEQ